MAKGKKASAYSGRATRSSSRALTLDNSLKGVEKKPPEFKKSLMRPAGGATPDERLRYAVIVTSTHYPVSSASDFSRNIRESLDEPFETQAMREALNSVQGPWVEAHSEGRIRWLPVVDEDFAAVNVVSDFVRLVYLHLIAVAS